MQTHTPRTLLVNGSLHTVNPRLPHAQALAVEGERILAVGSTEEILALARSGDERIDLGGRSLLPGLQDAHVHLSWIGLALQRIALTGVAALPEALRRVRAAAQQAREGAWLLGSGWNHNTWPVPERPTRWDLDSVAPSQPVALTSKDGHSLWLNSAALCAAGISAATPDPAGGQILRDASGEPTGIVTENAMELIKAAVPPESDVELDAAMRLAQREAAHWGLTSVHNCESAREFAALQRLHEAGALSLRVWQMVRSTDLDAALALGLRSGYGDALLCMGHLKMFADGALGSATAEMLAPYEDLDHRGVAATSSEVLYDAAHRAALGGIASAIHAIGDGANRRVLDLYARLREEGSETRLPHRIEHVQLLTPQDLPRLAALGVVASMQPIHAPHDREMAERRWGARARYGYALRSVLQSGATLILGTDSPVESLNPLVNLYAAVTRRAPEAGQAEGWYPDEALTLDEALYGYTLAPALSTGQAQHTGSLTPGKWADLVVLSRDLYADGPEALLETEVDLTMLGGRVLYRREGA